MGIARVVLDQSGVTVCERLGSNRIGAAPDQHLLLTVAGGRLGLIQPLQIAVMSFIEAPGMNRGQPHAIHFFEHGPK